MKYLILLAAICFIGCGMNNKEIADQVKYCHEQGLNVLVYRFLGDGVASKIECDPNRPLNKATTDTKEEGTP